MPVKNDLTTETNKTTIGFYIANITYSLQNYNFVKIYNIMDISQFTNNDYDCPAKYVAAYIRLRLYDNCTRWGPNMTGRVVSNHRREKLIQASFITVILSLFLTYFNYKYYFYIGKYI